MKYVNNFSELIQNTVHTDINVFNELTASQMDLAFKAGAECGISEREIQSDIDYSGSWVYISLPYQSPDWVQSNDPDAVLRENILYSLDGSYPEDEDEKASYDTWLAGRPATKEALADYYTETYGNDYYRDFETPGICKVVSLEDAFEDDEPLDEGLTVSPPWLDLYNAIVEQKYDY